MNLIASYPCTFWLVLGVLLSILEVFLPGLIVVFFGIGAIATGILALCIPPLASNWTVMLIVFAVLSAISLLIFRRKLTGRRENADSSTSAQIDEPCIGHHAVTITKVNKEGGTVEFNGVNWNAISDSEIDIGSRVTITKREGLTLFVEHKI